MQITLFIKDTIQNMILPEKVQGKYTFFHTTDKGKYEPFVHIEGVDGIWTLKAGAKTFLISDSKEKVLELPVMLSKVIPVGYRRSDDKALIYPQPITEDRSVFHHYDLPRQGNILIGRNESFRGCDINYQINYVSTKHAELRIDGDKLSVTDLGSTNGTYVNQVKVKEKYLEIGDVIELFGLKMIVGKGYLSINNPDGLVSINQSVLKPMSMHQLEKTNGESSLWAEEDDEDQFFYRSPRFRKGIEVIEFKIDPPPSYQEYEKTPMVLLLGPSLTMGMTSLIVGLISVQNALNNGGNMASAAPTLIMSGSMLVGTILWPILAKRYEQQKHEKKEVLRQDKYLKYLTEKKIELYELVEKQKQQLLENYIDVDACMVRGINKDRKLWERMIRHEDFLELRIGKGNLPPAIEIKAPARQFTLTDDNLQEEILQISETPLLMENVPVPMNLKRNWVSGIIGERAALTAFLQNFIVQLATLHSYDDLKICLVYNPVDEEIYKFAKWLPHVWSDDDQIRMMATNTSEVKEVFNVIEKAYFARVEIENVEELELLAPHYVVIALDKDLIEKTSFYHKILEDDKCRGFSLVNVFDELKYLPKECSAIIALDEAEGKLFDQNDLSGKAIYFTKDQFNRNRLSEFSKVLANTKLRLEDQEGMLPNMLTFLEMFGVQKIEHLNVLDRWRENNPVRSLEAPIGVLPSGDLFKLDLHEKYHGPHGLIAGMTGSGKSEFIMTFIMSLAVNYHPHEVAFILIDYKGGGMADAFAKLPHLAGTITNLDGASVKRSLISIQSELKRRQKIFSEAGKKLNTSNIDIYKYQNLFREGKVTEPLQHLFIISDEFAELKTQQPEFMVQLISAARIGRSLGVHLILATQKPAGVVDDQIWSNSKFRICLKVQERADSMDMIKRPDAAELKNTGRFYVQVGYNELFELGQSAWAGADYDPEAIVDLGEGKNLAVIDLVGKVVKEARLVSESKKVKDRDKQIDSLNKYLTKIADAEAIRIRPLWLPPLPSVIKLEPLVKEAKSQMGLNRLEPVLGMFDDPENQQQLPFKLPLSTEGNTILYSAQGAGEDLFMTALIQSIVLEKTPEEANLYILDFGSEALKQYEQLPHVGEVLLNMDEQKVVGLFKFLQEELVRRKSAFAEFGGEYDTYVAQTKKKVPHILVAIHNYSVFSELYEDLDDSLIYMTREGKKYGIVFVLTALNTNAIRFRLQTNFKQMLCLQMNDNNDYSSVLGNLEGLYPTKILGRGLFKSDRAYEFQTATPMESKILFEQFKNYSGTKARKIPVLPELLTVEEVMAIQASDDETLTPLQLPVALEKESIALTHYDFSQNVVNQLVSATGEHIYSLEAIMDLLDRKQLKMLVLDDGDDQLTIPDSAEKYVGASEIDKGIASLLSTMLYRNNSYKDALAEGLEVPEYEIVVVLINNLKRLRTLMKPESKTHLDLLLEKNQKAYNMCIILSDTKDNISDYVYDEWFRQHGNQSSGIWVGDGFADQNQLKTTKFSNEFYKTIDSDFGYILQKGKAKLVKMITSGRG